MGVFYIICRSNLVTQLGPRTLGMQQARTCDDVKGAWLAKISRPMTSLGIYCPGTLVRIGTGLGTLGQTPRSTLLYLYLQWV
jgi:hypothetical protein